MSAQAPAVAPADPEYIIDEILPAHEVHLVGGPSGAGKTSLTMQLLKDLRLNQLIFGKQSHSVPLVYVACDRSLEATKRTITRLGVTLDFPIISLIGSGIKRDIDNVVSNALRLEPNMRLLVIDAIGALTPGGKINDYQVVGDFLIHCSEICRAKGITVKGLGHSTKVKEGEDFKNPRQKFLGSVAWGGFSETMIYIEPSDPSNPTDPNRTIMVLPRNSPSLVLEYAFDQLGRLVPAGDISADLTLDVNLLKVPEGVPITTPQILEWAKPAGIPKRTVERWISDAIKSGKLERVEGRQRGCYRRPRPA